jgi:hypothetical protein
MPLAWCSRTTDPVKQRSCTIPQRSPSPLPNGQCSGRQTSQLSPSTQLCMSRRSRVTRYQSRSDPTEVPRLGGHAVLEELIRSPVADNSRTKKQPPANCHILSGNSTVTDSCDRCFGLDPIIVAPMGDNVLKFNGVPLLLVDPETCVTRLVVFIQLNGIFFNSDNNFASWPLAPHDQRDKELGAPQRSRQQLCSR